MSDDGIRCPGCASGMDRITVRGVHLDRCPACLGLWFDMGEFADTARCQVPPLQVHHASERRCPRCDAALYLATLGPAVVDWCRPCRGIYLDAGEFEEIVKGRPPLPTKARERWGEEGRAFGTLEYAAADALIQAIRIVR